MGVNAAFEALLKEVPVATAPREDLRRRLMEPHRHYHGVDHVGLLWRRHLQFGAGLAVCAPPWHAMIACAVAFHDAVLVPGRADNEIASAALFRATGPALPLPAVAWVEGTILATADHLAATSGGLPPEDWTARAWVLDLDLTPLGEEPADFEENTRRLRREFGTLPDAVWHVRNMAFLLRMAGATRIYRSKRLRAAFEAQARANIRTALNTIPA